MKALQYPFTVAGDRTIGTTSDYAQIVRGQIIDALMTNLGERVFRPRYGCDIQAAVFDPADELVRADAAGLIKNRLEALVTRAIIRSVVVKSGDSVRDLPLNTVIIEVVYRPSLYATDTILSIPVASEFLTRQRALESRGGAV